METTVVIGMSPEELSVLIAKSIREELIKFQPQPHPSNHKLLSRKEAAEYLDISLPTLDKYTKLGRIRGTRLGGRVLYSDEDLEKSLTEIPVKQTA